jgi:spore coat protein U-like protein
VTCTTGGAYSVSLSAGLNAVAAQRYVKSETNVLAYDLYKDSARGTVWTNVAAPVTGTGTGTAQTIPIYGRIAAGLPFSADNGSDYADTVIVTLTF